MITPLLLIISALSVFNCSIGNAMFSPAANVAPVHMMWLVQLSALQVQAGMAEQVEKEAADEEGKHNKVLCALRFLLCNRLGSNCLFGSICLCLYF